MLRTRETWTAVLAVLTVLALTPAAHAAPQVAAIDINPTTVAWQPQVADGGFVLTVSMPGGEVLRQEFAPGTVPSFGLFDEAGAARPDGSYTYELLVLPPSVPSEVADARGDAAAMAKLQATGVAPERQTASGHFRVVGGSFYVPTGEVETGERPAGDAPARVAAKDQVILDDLIVDGSICAGLDCVNGESFGFDTLRLKENNLRIKAQDTSSSASFPSNDWQITFNESSNGGANKFSIDDIDGGRTPFTIEAGAPSHSLYVDDGGRIGIGTSTPVVELHVKNGDSPTLRLEQDGSSGFTAQTWDVAGNETNFFVRDATNGSRLPLRIRPSAPSNSIFVDTDGDVGMGTSSPADRVHVTGTSDPTILIEDTNISGDNRPGLTLRSPAAAGAGTAGNADWDFQTDNAGNFQINFTGSAGPELLITDATTTNGSEIRLNGNVVTPIGTTMTVNGNLTVVGTCTGCDAVFQPDFELESIEEHAELMWAQSYLPGVGPTPEGETKIDVFEKTTGILQELEKAHIYIAQLNDEIKTKDARLVELEERLARIEAALLDADR